MSTPLDLPRILTWVGREEMRTEVAAIEPIERLADLLDHQELPWPRSSIPPLAHWLYFAPRARASEIDVDGHPKRGGLLPPVPLPRRMWAGGEIEFLRPVAPLAEMRRKSRIVDIRPKTGSTGQLIFVTLTHEIRVDDQLAIRERQDLVYREPAHHATPTLDSSSSLTMRKADLERTIAVTPPDLFRFSALTYNAHRIHYDRDYARDVEGYAGLVVHGPFSALLMMDLLLRNRAGLEIRRFAFRGVRPLLDTAPFSLCLTWEQGGAALWCRGADGAETMTASAAWA